LHHQRGDAVCSNALTIRRDDLEDRLLRGLSESVLRQIEAARESDSRNEKKKANLVPGARIELATPAFSGRRSTSELPRHGGNLLILGAHGSRVKYDREEREED
jgi:hypothetical protein